MSLNKVCFKFVVISMSYGTNLVQSCYGVLVLDSVEKYFRVSYYESNASN